MKQAPFTKREIEKLNEYQFSDKMHPFTCLNQGDKAHIEHEFSKLFRTESFEEYVKLEKSKGVAFPDAPFKQTKLIAIDKGWICPVCDYTQDWAH